METGDDTSSAPAPAPDSPASPAADPPPPPPPPPSQASSDSTTPRLVIDVSSDEEEESETEEKPVVSVKAEMGTESKAEAAVGAVEPLPLEQEGDHTQLPAIQNGAAWLLFSGYYDLAAGVNLPTFAPELRPPDLHEQIGNGGPSWNPPLYWGRPLAQQGGPIIRFDCPLRLEDFPYNHVLIGGQTLVGSLCVWLRVPW